MFRSREKLNDRTVSLSLPDLWISGWLFMVDDLRSGAETVMSCSREPGSIAFQKASLLEAQASDSEAYGNQRTDQPQ
jgi:hypothetical protein